MSNSLVQYVQDLIYPLLKIESRTPSIPHGHENDTHLSIIRADDSFWRYTKLFWLIYTLIWAFGIAIGTIVAFLTIPFVAWLSIIVALFATVKSLIMFVVLRITYELRWYIITDTSITIRQGALTVREITVSFQNIQNISVSQGPLERYFGFSNLTIETAGSAGPTVNGEQHNPNQAILKGLVNAPQIRDAILNNLRLFRNSGLGDPDDQGIKDYGLRVKDSQNELSARRVEVLKEILFELENVS